MKLIKLDLKAKHFWGTTFCNNKDCSIARAAKEVFPTAKRIEEGVSDIYIDNTVYSHERYTRDIFDYDKRAARNVDPDTVIRTITLEESGVVDERLRIKL